jgi:TetR/AcrR family transcriptional repressor of mexJK operon
MSNEVESARGRPKDDAKREAILEAAKAVFLENGFDRASVDAIAAAAGVSKVTVYSHFPGGKEEVFVAAVSRSAEDVFGGAVVAVAQGVDLETVLAELGRDFMVMVSEPDCFALQNVMMQERERHPDLPQLFYELVIRRWSRVLAGVFRREKERGAIVCEDPDLCARQFIAMVHGEFKYKQMLGIEPVLPVAEVEAYARASAALFVRALRPQPSA